MDANTTLIFIAIAFIGPIVVTFIAGITYSNFGGCIYEIMAFLMIGGGLALLLSSSQIVHILAVIAIVYGVFLAFAGHSVI